MLRILMVTARREIVRSFVEGLSSDAEVCLDFVSSGARLSILWVLNVPIW